MGIRTGGDVKTAGEALNRAFVREEPRGKAEITLGFRHVHGLAASQEVILAKHKSEIQSNEPKQEEQAVSRRRLLKTMGVAATVGAGNVLAGQPAPAGASTDNGAFSTGTSTPAVSAVSTGTGAAVQATKQSPGGAAVKGVSASLGGAGIGVYGSANGDDGIGVRGFALGDGSAVGVAGVSASDSGTGVQGTVSAPEGYGVVGRNLDKSGPAMGVLGTSDSDKGTGVQGTVNATSGFGVVGLNNATSGVGAIGVGGQSSSPDGCGVEGLNFATSGAAAVGVFGQSTSPAGSGVEGLETSTSGAADGVYGEARSPDGHGVFGANIATSGTAVGAQGTTKSPDGFGLVGVNAAKTGRSVGVFAQTGNTKTGFGLLCKGRLATTSVVVSGFPFLGTMRSLYSVASPECWLEDFGSAGLVDGAADVALDPVFSAAVLTDKYSVFVVPEGDCRGLYISEKGPQGFTVRELQGGKATVPFSYRVVARRQDVEAPRLGDVDLAPEAPQALDRTRRGHRQALPA